MAGTRSEGPGAESWSIRLTRRNALLSPSLSGILAKGGTFATSSVVQKSNGGRGRWNSRIKRSRASTAPASLFTVLPTKPGMPNAGWDMSPNGVRPVEPNAVTGKKAEGAVVVEAAGVAAIALQLPEAVRADSSPRMPIPADDANSSRPLVPLAAKRRLSRSVRWRAGRSIVATASNRKRASNSKPD